MKSILIALAFIFTLASNAQTGNFGIGTATPGSKLTVNGSMGLAHKKVTANYLMTADDYYLSWSGASAGIITLPAASSGGSNYKGRVYVIKNASTGQSLTISASTAELIEQSGGSGLASISIASGQNLVLISNGASNGITWEVESLGSAVAVGGGLQPGTAPGQMLYWNGSTWQYVAPGQNGQTLTYINGVPTWAGNIPKIATVAATAVSYEIATSGGNIIRDGDFPILEKGLCWSTSPNPTIADSRTSNGPGASSFSNNITGLVGGTTYYARAYASNVIGTYYGENISFTTTPYGPIVISTRNTFNTSYESSSGGGNITSDGGRSISERGVCWSLSPNPTIPNDPKYISGSGPGIYTSYLLNLKSGTTYYTRAYAVINEGTSYGNEIVFTTLAYALPTVGTSAFSIVGPNAAGGGTAAYNGGGTPATTARGVCYGTSPKPTLANSFTTDGTGNGTFSSSIPLASLTANTTYYVRAYATNAAGTGYGSEVSFTTQAFYVGQSHQGGLIYYLDGTGEHGLIVGATNAAVDIEWGPRPFTTSVTNTAMGTGAANTDLIVASQGEGNYAANAAKAYNAGGYSDWYLPSLDELTALYHVASYLGITTEYTDFWSSSEYSEYDAWAIRFNDDGSPTAFGKIASLAVRAVRSF